MRKRPFPHKHMLAFRIKALFAGSQQVGLLPTETKKD
jgi:hypothetical protein